MCLRELCGCVSGSCVGVSREFCGCVLGVMWVYLREFCGCVSGSCVGVFEAVMWR